MNRLWVRLSLAFSAVALIAMVIIIGTGVLVARAGAGLPTWRTLLKAPSGILDKLGNYYQTHQTWQGVESVLSGVESAMPPEVRLRFSIQDAADQEEYPVVPDTGTRRLESTPIVVDGQTRGILNIYRLNEDPMVGFASRAIEVLSNVGIIGGLIGIIFGVLVSRGLTAPLERLAKAAQAIGARDLNRRVDLKGSKEVVAVAQAFNDMAAALQQAETLRRNLVADVAHELRTPLSVLQGNLLAILDGVYPLEAAEIARLYDQTDHLSRLVTDLHDLSLADAQQLHLNLQPTDVNDLLKRVAAAFEPTAEVDAVRLELQIQDNLPFALLDPTRLTQVLDNLLGNALRHTPADGTITLNAAIQNSKLLLTVKDTGEGIPSEHLPHVFDRFYRTDRARSRVTGGSGLGLAIVRAIVEMHGGQVSATSDGIPGRGTTFTVQLPLAQAVPSSEIR